MLYFIDKIMYLERKIIIQAIFKRQGRNLVLGNIS